METCTGCKKPIREEYEHYLTCNTCGAQSHYGCNSHCVCDDIPPDRVGDGRFGAMLNEAMQRRGMSIEELTQRLTEQLT